MLSNHSGFTLDGIISGLSWVMTYFSPFFQVLTGTGSVWQGFLRMRAYTGAIASSTASNYIQIYRKGVYSFSYGVDFVLEVVFSHLATSGANGKSYLKIDDDTGPNDPDSVAVGFRVDNNALKGIVHNGSSLTVVDLSVTLTSVPVRLLIKFTAGSKIEWYVNGTKKGESSNVPSGSDVSYLVLAVKNGVDTADQQAAVGRLAYWEEW